MNSLTSGIEMVIKNAIEEYSSIIASRFNNISAEDLEGIWNDISEGMKISVSFRSTKEPVKTSPKVNDDVVSDTDRLDGCPYVFTKGARQKEECGTAPKNGNTYCGKHKKYEGVETQKTKKILPKPGKVKSIGSLSAVKKTSPIEKPVRKIFKMNKIINKLVHEDTGLILKSSSIHVAIGVFRDDKICKLNSEDIDNCKLYGLKYEVDEVEEEEVVNDVEEEVVNDVEEEVEEEEEVVNDVEEEVEEEEEEEEVEEEEVEEEEDELVVKKISPENLKNKKVNKNISLVPKKAFAIKDAVMNTINHTLLQGADIEDVLNELKLGSDSYSDSGEEVEFSEEEN